MIKFWIFFLLATLASFNAYADPQTPYVIPKIEDKTIANPTLEQAAADARNAAKAKDFRFMAVYGQTIYCPGIMIDATTFPNIQKNGVIGVLGINDSSNDESGRQRNDQLVAYAKQYNKTILAAYKAETD